MARDEERRSKRSRRSSRRRQQEEWEETGFMAEGDEEAPAEDAAPAEDGGDAGGDAAPADDAGDAPAEEAPADDAGGDDGGDAGGDDGGDAGGDDGGDAGGDAGGDDSANWDRHTTAYFNKIQGKLGKNARVKFFVICNMFEAAAAELLVYALDNPMEKEATLQKRSDLLQALYYLRFVCDVDDDFTLEEYEGEMEKIKIFRSKMGRLAAKEQVQRDSDDEDSSDDSEGDENFLETLKGARKEMQYTFGQPE